MPAIVHPLKIGDRSCLGIGRFLIFLPLLACSQAAGSPTKAQVQITPVGCAIRHADGRCELQKSGFLRLFIESPRPFERVVIYQGKQQLPLDTLGPKSDRRRVFRIQATPQVDGLTVRVHFPRGEIIERTLPVRALQDPDWLRQADQAWLDNHGKEAEDILKREFSKPSKMAPRHHALARLLWGRIIALERSAWEQAEGLLQQAREECSRIGIVSCQIDAALALSRLAIQQHRLPVAEQTLHSLQAPLERMPEMVSWVRLQEALIARQHGNLSLALHLLDEEIETATRYQDGEALSEGHALMAKLLTRLGTYDSVPEHLHAARRALVLVEPEQEEPCRPIYRILAESQWLMDLRSEVEWRLDEARWRLWPKRDPRPLLEEASERARDQCKQEGLRATIALHRARAELMDRQWDETKRWLDEVRRTQKNLSLGRLIEWTELSAELALGRGEHQQALDAFQQLLELTKDSDARGSWFETRWRARVGMGQALEASNSEAAIEAYDAAERTLDAWVRLLPFGEGRRSFFDGHAFGTGCYVDLLLRRKSFREALSVIRRAALRVHREYAQARSLSDLSHEGQRAWEASLAAYRAVDLEWSKAAAKLSLKIVPSEEEPELKRQQPGLNRMLWKRAEQVLKALGEPEDPPLPAPKPHEVLLACHPVPRMWSCLAADGQQVVEARPARLDRGISPEQLAAQLIAPLERPLRAAKRLRVIARGEFDQIDLHRLPFPGGGTLEEHLAIVYTLDLPRLATPDASPEEVLLLVNPQGLEDFSIGTRTLQNNLTDVLQRDHRVRLFPLEIARHGQWFQPKAIPSSRSARPTRLGDALARSDLFIYFGHAKALVHAGLQSRLLLDEAGFKVSDILALPRVPRQVVLAGCETGFPGENALGTGGRAGDLGLAQAFLLRGSQWVLGTVRPVLAGVAVDLLLALFGRERLGEPGVDPATALHKARQWVSDHPELSRGLPAGERDRSLDAFRAFEP